MRQPTDRPSQRRCSEEPGGVAAARGHLLVTDVTRAAGGSSGTVAFHGFASVYNSGYSMYDMFGPYTEQVSSGAGAASLAREDLDVPFVLQHDPLRRMARTLNGSLSVYEATEQHNGEDAEGLVTDAPKLSLADPDVAYIVPKLESGLIDEMSFRFRITAGSWSPDWTEYHIEEYDIHRGDVAIVGYGANPATAGSGLRSALDLDDMTDSQLRELERRLSKLRKARGLDTASTSGMTWAEVEAAHRGTLLTPLD